MNELDLGRLLQSFCNKNGVPVGKEVNLLKLLADVGGVAEALYTKNEKVNSSIKAITGEDSMMVCPNCGSHVIIEYKTCIACGEELFEGAKEAQPAKPSKTAQPSKTKEPVKEVKYPAVKDINKMKKPELEEWVNLLELDVDMNGKLKDIRDAIKAEIKDLKSIEPVKTSESETTDEDVLDDLAEEDTDIDNEFEEEELEEDGDDDLEEEDLEEEDLEEEELDEEFEEEDEEELDDEEEDLEDDDEELEDDEDDEEDLEEEDEDLEEDDDEEEDLEEELDDEEEDLEEEDDDLDEEFEDEDDEEEEDLEDEEEDLDEEEEEPAPKKKASKKVTKKAPSKLADKKAEREKKREALRKKIPSFVKKPSLLEKLEHSDRVSLQTMLGEEQGNKKSLAELKGEAMFKHLKKQLAIWKKKNSKK